MTFLDESNDTMPEQHILIIFNSNKITDCFQGFTYRYDLMISEFIYFKTKYTEYHIRINTGRMKMKHKHLKYLNYKNT